MPAQQPQPSRAEAVLNSLKNAVVLMPHDRERDFAILNEFSEDFQFFKGRNLNGPRLTGPCDNCGWVLARELEGADRATPRRQLALAPYADGKRP